jgi:hypothetical protein
VLVVGTQQLKLLVMSETLRAVLASRPVHSRFDSSNASLSEGRTSLGATLTGSLVADVCCEIGGGMSCHCDIVHLAEAMVRFRCREAEKVRNGLLG